MQICKSCSCGCCRNYAIGLTGYDILNISNTLSIEPESFIQLVSVNDEKDIEEQSKYVALFKFSDGKSDALYRFNLSMEESRLVPGTLKCLFLVEWYSDTQNPSMDSIIAKCGIYSCRPFTCAAYPSILDDTGSRAIVTDVSTRISNENPIYNQCPRKFTQEDIKDGSEHIMGTLIRRKYEVDYFKNLAAYWNQKPGLISDFLPFMKNVYQNRVSLENI